MPQEAQEPQVPQEVQAFREEAQVLRAVRVRRARHRQCGVRSRSRPTVRMPPTGVSPRSPRPRPTCSRRCARMGRGGCEVVSFPGNLCVGLANYKVGRYRGTYTAGANTSPEAQRNAIERCNGEPKARGRCSLRTVVCGDGR